MKKEILDLLEKGLEVLLYNKDNKTIYDISNVNLSIGRWYDNNSEERDLNSGNWWDGEVNRLKGEINLDNCEVFAVCKYDNFTAFDMDKINYLRSQFPNTRFFDKLIKGFVGLDAPLDYDLDTYNQSTKYVHVSCPIDDRYYYIASDEDIKKIKEEYNLDFTDYRIIETDSNHYSLD